VFATLFTAFREAAFLAALADPQKISAALAQFFDLEKTGHPTWTSDELLIDMFIQLTALSEPDRYKDPVGPKVAETVMEFRELLTWGFDLPTLLALAPPPNGPFQPYDDSSDLPRCQAVPDGADGGLGLDANWGEVTGAMALNAWGNSPSQPNGLCVTKAVGMCMHRLGKDDNSVSCDKWVNLSQRLKATRGVPLDNLEPFFAPEFCFHRATDCPGFARAFGCNSACEEARDAWARGCDVFIDFLYTKDADAGATAHFEYVHRVTVDPGDSNACTVESNAWGATGKTRIASGDFTRMQGGTTAPTGKGALYYACPCK
jgi:hypothetical protein